MSYRELRKLGKVEDIIAFLLEAKARLFAPSTARFILNPIKSLSEQIRLQDQTMTLATIPRFSYVINFGNNGTLAGTPAFVTGKFARDARSAKAIRGDGTDDDIRIADAASLKPASQFTWNFWIKPLVTPAANKGMMVKAVAGTAPASRVLLQSDLKFTAIDFRINAIDRTLTSTNALSTTAFQMITIQYDGATFAIYKDNVLEASLAVTGALAWNSESIVLLNYPPLAAHFVNADLAEPMIFSRGLSNTERALLLKGGLISKDLVLFLPFYNNDGADSSGGITGLEEVNA